MSEEKKRIEEKAQKAQFEEMKDEENNTAPAEQQPAEKKPNIFKRSWAWIKRNKTGIAFFGGVGLAALGKTAFDRLTSSEEEETDQNSLDLPDDAGVYRLDCGDHTAWTKISECPGDFDKALQKVMEERSSAEEHPEE